ncbi:MAG: hypothetical protein K0Q81_323, partial [Paenibacillus sp.]|nr:hypothetical protein [Paenibacillus sp.]
MRVKRYVVDSMPEA